jgi:hypothetical protein
LCPTLGPVAAEAIENRAADGRERFALTPEFVLNTIEVIAEVEREGAIVTDADGEDALFSFVGEFDFVADGVAADGIGR